MSSSQCCRKAAISTCSECLATPLTFPESPATDIGRYKYPLLGLFTNVGSNAPHLGTFQGTDYAPGLNFWKYLVQQSSCG